MARVMGILTHLVLSIAGPDLEWAGRLVGSDKSDFLLIINGVLCSGEKKDGDQRGLDLDNFVTLSCVLSTL